MAGLRPTTDVNEVSYNGFRFPPALELQVESAPVYDESERQVLYVKHRIEVDCIIHEGVDQPYAEPSYVPTFPTQAPENNHNYYLNDQEVRSLRKILTQPGGHLVVNNVGFGGIRTLAENPDVNFGPKPELLGVRPLGAGRAVRIKWACTVCIPECDGNLLAKDRGLLVHNRTHSWSVKDGLTTRTITGHLIIANRRQGMPTAIGYEVNPNNGSLQDTASTNSSAGSANYLRINDDADAYLSQINVEVPERFRRMSFNRELSLDKSRLDYRIIDQEVASPNAYPSRAIEIDIQQTTRSDNFRVGFEWQVEISGSISLAPDTPIHWAWLAFSEIITQRRQIARDQIRKVKEGEFEAEDGETKPARIITRKFSFTEHLFEYRMDFSITWDLKILRDYIFIASGLGKEIAGDDTTRDGWIRWRRSMDDVWRNRGIAELGYDRSTETLIGFCDQGTTPAIESFQTNPEEHPIPPLIESDCDQVTQENSWVFIRTQPMLREATGRMDHVVLESDLEFASAGAQYPVNRGEISTGGYTLPGRVSPSTPTTVQSRAPSHWELLFVGSAMRIKYDIPQPVVLMYGGVEARPIGEMKFQKEAWNDPVNGCRMTSAYWSQLYSLAGKPSGETVVTENSSLNF